MEEEYKLDQNQVSNKYENRISGILSILVFLIPIFFIPLVSVPVAKSAFVLTLTIILGLVFLWRFLALGHISVVKSKIWIPLILFSLAIIASSLLSGSFSSSFVGNFFELGTGGSLLALVFLIFLVSILANSVNIARKIQKAFMLSAFVLSLDFLFLVLASYGAISQKILNYIPIIFTGGFADLSIVLACASIFAMHSLSVSTVSRKKKYIFLCIIFATLLSLGIIGINSITLLFGLFTLALFVYFSAWRATLNQDERRSVFVRPSSIINLGVLVVSIIFLIGGSSLSGFLSKVLKVQNFEVRPNTEATFSIAKESWKKNPFLGSGPNRFGELWDVHKPIELNNTNFWDVTFYYGSSLITTLLVTTGILGTGLLIAFLAMYIYIGFRSVFMVNENGAGSSLSSLFFASLFLWIVSFVYTPGIVVVALAATLTGIFIASLGFSNILPMLHIDASRNKRTNFISIFSTIVLLVGTVAIGYYSWEKLSSYILFERSAAIFATEGNTERANSYLNKALVVSPSDIYLRRASEVSLAGLQSIVYSISAKGVENLTEQERITLQQKIGEVLNYGRAAVDLDKENYLNWFNLGRVYEILATSGMEGAHQSAINMYVEAKKFAPNNPKIELALARLNVISGKTDAARENIKKTLELKSNYTDAYFTLAQLEAAVNNLSGAIQSVETATLIDPNNAGLYFQLGLLKYNRNDYIGAASAFERAVVLVPDYANARYFLGLSLYRLGKINDAVKQFEEVEKTNQNNSEIKLILSNLRAGKRPFADAVPPIDDTPESREEPPIEEN